MLELCLSLLKDKEILLQTLGYQIKKYDKREKIIVTKTNKIETSINILRSNIFTPNVVINNSH